MFTPFAIENRFKWSMVESWLKHNWWQCFLYALLYYVGIRVGTAYMAKRQRFELRVPMIFWSGFLALFSIVATVRTLPELVSTLYNSGLQGSVCDNSIYDNPVLSLWTFLFILSKPWEFGDTFFIIMRKQHLSFLHWYHHITVMLFSWYCASHRNPFARWFGIMNYVVHSIMYTYYTLKALRVQMPKTVSMMVTSIQILQMIIGAGIAIYTAVIKFCLGTPCHTSTSSIIYGLLLYASYFVLFAQFFTQAYMKKTGPPPQPKTNGHYQNGVVSAKAD